MFQDRATTAAASVGTSATAGSAVVGVVKGRGKVEDDPFTIDR